MMLNFIYFGSKKEMTNLILKKEVEDKNIEEKEVKKENQNGKFIIKLN